MTDIERAEKIRDIIAKLKELGCLPTGNVDANSPFCLALGLDQDREITVEELQA
jgi:hypothetical protein